MDIPILGQLRDPRPYSDIVNDEARADEYAEKGSVKHFLLRLGFFPDNEAVAEEMLRQIIREHEFYREWIEDHTCSR